MPVDWHGPAIMAKARRAAAEAMQAGAIVLQVAIKQNLSKGGSSNRSNEGKAHGGKNLAVGTGNLRRSIQVAPIEVTGNIIKTRVGTNVVYAKIHEFGGVIVAKGRALTIPVSKKAKAAASRGVGARAAFPDSFILKTGKSALIVRDPSRGKNKMTGGAKVSKTGRPTVMQKPSMGNRGGKSLSHALVKVGGAWKKLEVLYVLVRSVRIPPRPYFRPAVQQASVNIRQTVVNTFKSLMGRGI